MRTSLTLLFIFINFLGIGIPQPLFAVSVPGKVDITATVPPAVPPPAVPPPAVPGPARIPPPAPVTGVTLSGRAYPRSTITVLKDAQIAAITVADANANFSLSITGISSGNYIFSVYSEDKRGIRSSLLTFPISVTLGAIVNISGIFIAPTIAVDKSEVRRGDNIAIFGQTTPHAEITISVASEEEFFVKTPSDKDGIYLYNFNTSPLKMGRHHTKSKAALDGKITSWGKTVGFTVGTKNVLVRPEVLKSDLNNDNRVNLVDFSIIAYWYKRPNPPANVDLNGDRKIDLVDFSIMAFYWTG